MRDYGQGAGTAWGAVQPPGQTKAPGRKVELLGLHGGQKTPPKSYLKLFVKISVNYISLLAFDCCPVRERQPRPNRHK